VLVVNDRKFLAGTIFFSHTKPANNTSSRTSNEQIQPNEQVAGYLIILRPNSSSSFACVNLHKTVSDSQRYVVPLSMSYVNDSSLFFRVLFRAEPQSFNNWIKRRLHPCRWHTTCLLTMKVQKPPGPTTHNQNAEKQ